MYVFVCFVIGLVASTHAKSTVTTYAKLGDSFTLNFEHNFQGGEIDAGDCEHNNITVATYGGTGPKLHGRWVNRVDVAHNIPGTISVTIKKVEEEDDGYYVCTIQNAGRTATKTPNVTLESYSPTNITQTTVPEPTENNILGYFYKKYIEIDLNSNCSKPPANFTVTTDTGYAVNYTSKACGNKQGYGTSSLMAKIQVNGTMTVTVRKGHPSITDKTPIVYRVQLQDLCESTPCSKGETCIGNTMVYNCTCPEGYVTDARNGTVCKGALTGKLGIKLGTGAIVGIAVGAGALVVIIVVIVVMFLRKKKAGTMTAEKKKEKAPKEMKNMETSQGAEEPMLKKPRPEPRNVKVDLEKGEVKMERSQET